VKQQKKLEGYGSDSRSKTTRIGNPQRSGRKKKSLGCLIRTMVKMSEPEQKRILSQKAKNKMLKNDNEAKQSLRVKSRR